MLISSDLFIISLHQPMKRKSTLDTDVIQLSECIDFNDSDTSSSSNSEHSFI